MTDHIFAAAVCVLLLSASPVAAEEVDGSLGPALDKLQTGDPEGAVRSALEVAREDPGHLKAWYLCGMVRFNVLGDYAGAIECLDRLTGLVLNDGHEFSELRYVYRGRGMSHFMLGDFARAEADLSAGIELEPDDVHAHLLWYLAASRAGIDGEERLRKFVDAHPDGSWPHPIIPYYLGASSAEDCIAAASAGRGHLCEAHFYIAELHLLRGDTELAATHFEKCLHTGKRQYGEYRMAQKELERLAD